MRSNWISARYTALVQRVKLMRLLLLLWGQPNIDKAFLWIIYIYQRFVSPIKGFRCAAGVYYASDGCSNVVKKIIEENGAFRGRFQIRRQFRLCAAASRALLAEKRRKNREDADEGVTRWVVSQKRPVGLVPCGNNVSGAPELTCSV